MRKSEFYIASKDEKNKLHCVLWEPVGAVKAVLQISHGMVEYIDRYDRFAEFLNEAGVAVVGNDHLGHGKTAATEEDLGYFCEEEPSKTVVEDLYQVTCKMKEKYKGIPYFVMGHSMGSFLIRRYIMTYGDKVDGVVISATGSLSHTTILAGKCLIRFLSTWKRERHRSAFFDYLCFGNYNKKIKNARTSKDWLSKDEKMVDAYLKHPYCTFTFTMNGFWTLFSTIGFIQKQKNVKKIPKELPVLFVAGDADPVGNYGKNVKKVYEKYKREGIKDISLILYPDARHELTNEVEYLKVYQDILSWIVERLHNIN